ncbi:MAG: galactokinase [Oscillospiraceae bacterium]|nr:galactokinase [Oscillospiraceae bacterium]
MSTTNFENLYQSEDAKTRFAHVTSEFEALFKYPATRFFSAPGRTEICGNHTDHNRGRVVAAAVNLDVFAAVKPQTDGVITIKSEGFPIDTVDTRNLDVHESEKNTSASLIRGVCMGLKNRGYKVGGFTAYTQSNVLKGSGLSSSAAFEVLLVTILSHLYNDGKVSDIEAAQIAQYAENVYFGKPSGLMDQMASSVGGVVGIDFEDLEKPVVKALSLDLGKYGCSVCIVDTKGNHAHMTPEYAAVPAEMKAVAAMLDKEVLRELTIDDVINNLPKLREILGDRAVLRALHFFDENKRVDELVKAIEDGDFEKYLSVIKASGDSSYKYLQNVYASSVPTEQGVSLGLYMSEKLLAGKGATRVHGGGFAGTIQAYVPDEMLESYRVGMEKVFGEGSVYALKIRPVGGTEVIVSCE